MEAVKVSSKKQRADTVKSRHKVRPGTAAHAPKCVRDSCPLPQFDWAQELKRLNAEEATLDRDLLQFTAQIAEADEPGERPLSMAEVKMSHNRQLDVFRAQLGAIKMLLRASARRGEGKEGEEEEGEGFARRATLLRAGNILNDLSAMMEGIGAQLEAEEKSIMQQVRRACDIGVRVCLWSPSCVSVVCVLWQV